MNEKELNALCRSFDIANSYAQKEIEELKKIDAELKRIFGFDDNIIKVNFKKGAKKNNGKRKKKL